MASLFPSHDLPMQAEAPEQVLERPTAPAVNTGAQAPVDGPSILQKGAVDSDYYRENREAIHKAWRSKYSTRG